MSITRPGGSHSGPGCTNRACRNGELLATYTFADAASGKYVSQFLPSRVSFVNQIPFELLGKITTPILNFLIQPSLTRNAPKSRTLIPRNIPPHPIPPHPLPNRPFLHPPTPIHPQNTLIPTNPAISPPQGQQKPSHLAENPDNQNLKANLHYKTETSPRRTSGFL